MKDRVAILRAGEVEVHETAAFEGFEGAGNFVWVTGFEFTQGERFEGYSGEVGGGGEGRVEGGGEFCIFLLFFCVRHCCRGLVCLFWGVGGLMLCLWFVREWEGRRRYKSSGDLVRYTVPVPSTRSGEGVRFRPALRFCT